MAKNRDSTLPKTKLDQARERAQYDYDHAVSSAIRVASHRQDWTRRR